MIEQENKRIPNQDCSIAEVIVYWTAFELKTLQK